MDKVKKKPPDDEEESLFQPISMLVKWCYCLYKMLEIYQKCIKLDTSYYDKEKHIFLHNVCKSHFNCIFDSLVSISNNKISKLDIYTNHEVLNTLEEGYNFINNLTKDLLNIIETLKKIKHTDIDEEGIDYPALSVWIISNTKTLIIQLNKEIKNILENTPSNDDATAIELLKLSDNVNKQYLELMEQYMEQYVR